MEIEKSKVLMQFLLFFRQSGDVLSFLYARRLRGYTATDVKTFDTLKNFIRFVLSPRNIIFSSSGIGKPSETEFVT